MSTRLSLKRSLVLNPELDLVVRANEEKDIELLYQMGAKEVVQPEFEASLEITTHLFAGLGFPLVGIQQNIQQIRASHYLTLRPERSQEQIFREIKVATQAMRSRQYSLPLHSPLIGKTLEKSYFRRLTGVILLSITRSQGEKIDYPAPETVIQEGDIFLLVGEVDELAAFDRLAKGNIILPQENSSCIWLLVPKNSGIAGKTLATISLEQQFGTVVQAIRRKGKYIRFPDEDNLIQSGDYLLLFGSLELLAEIGQKIAVQETLVTSPNKN